MRAIRLVRPHVFVLFFSHANPCIRSHSPSLPFFLCFFLTTRQACTHACHPRFGPVSHSHCLPPRFRCARIEGNLPPLKRWPKQARPTARSATTAWTVRCSCRASTSSAASASRSGESRTVYQRGYCTSFWPNYF